MTPRLPVRVRLGALLIEAATWLALRGLRLVGAAQLVVRTPEAARQADEAEHRLRVGAPAALNGPRECPCPRCTHQRSQAAARWN
jgi:hypothetical protein